MTVIDELAAEWPRLARSPGMRAALARWGAQDPHLRFPDLAGLVARVQSRSTPPAAADAVLAALARRAPADQDAARVLLHLLLPGCKALVRRWHTGESREERAAFVVALVYDRIRTYPYDRRPRRIAANVLLDVHQRLFRSAGRPVRTVPLDAAPEPVAPVGAEPEPARELVATLGRAVRDGLLDGDAARLIVLTRVAGVPVADLARREGLSEQTLRRRRLRAEERLKRLVAA